MHRRDLRRKLQALGREPAPRPSVAFVASLWDRLRVLGPRGSGSPATGARRFAVAVLTVAAVAALVAGVLIASPRPPEGSLALSSARDAIVTLPDGSNVEARDGLVVPPGSTIRTGRDGDVRVDGDRLGPDAEATVSGGRMRRVVASPRPVATPAPTREPTPRPDATPAPTREPTPRPTPTPDATAMTLACRVLERPAIHCEWSRPATDAVRGYRLWRSDGTRQVVFRTGDVTVLAYTDRDVSARTTYVYVIEALGADGRVVASGGPVRVAASG